MKPKAPAPARRKKDRRLRLRARSSLAKRVTLSSVSNELSRGPAGGVSAMMILSVRARAGLTDRLRRGRNRRERELGAAAGRAVRALAVAAGPVAAAGGGGPAARRVILIV